MPTETAKPMPIAEMWAPEVYQLVASTLARIAQGKRTIAITDERVADTQAALDASRERLKRPLG